MFPVPRIPGLKEFEVREMVRRSVRTTAEGEQWSFVAEIERLLPMRDTNGILLDLANQCRILKNSRANKKALSD